MRLEAISSSRAAKLPNINESSKIGTDENKVDKQQNRELHNQRQRTEETKHVEDRKYSEEEIIKIIETANNEFVAYDRRFEFSIHEKTKQIMVKILDSETDEVIKELPPEKILDMVAGIWEVAGIIVDKKI